MVEVSNPSGDANHDVKTIERPMKTKHPLQNRWVFWFLKGDRTKNWEECLKQIVVIDSVEDFWGVYLQVVPASGLSFGSDYYLFREGIKPMWEDAQNVKGGRWYVVVDKQQRSTRLDELWLELLMAVVGEQFESHGNYICGAAVNLRQKGDKVALWTSDSSVEQVNRRIGIIFKNKLNVVNENIRYEVHRDASLRTGSQVKPKFVISKESSKEKSTSPTVEEPPKA
ncbi:hypothetical protein M3Y94_00170900 [Aphelenchoides besseyi]|nr:hypothetical protein M3Y94_00170900 [Aphelenchoides besseyi]KAI6236980.1 EIF-4F 25 kDa subunit [Aphelenchoides besseyi]